MANVDQPMGLKPVGHLQGIDLEGLPIWWCKHLATDSTAIGLYDAVTMVDAGTDAVYQEVEQADAGDRIYGVAVAFRSDAPGGTITLAGSDDIPRDEYCPASTLMYVGVYRDPFIVYEIQEDSVGVNLAAGNLGACVDLVVAAASATNGMSQMEIDSSTVTVADSTASAGTGQLQILGLAQHADGNNAVGTNANWLVRIVELDVLATAGL